MKKFIALAVMLCAVMISSSVTAERLQESTREYATLGVKRDHNLFVDMYDNPTRYIAFGGVGTGVSVFIDRDSIDVQKYEPPIYIIAFRKIYFSVQPSGAAAGSRIERYMYNYDERKMYQEFLYRDGNYAPHWELIDPKRDGTSGARSLIAAGEILFCLAYNMSFYDKPESYFLQEYFKRGTWITFGTR